MLLPSPLLASGFWNVDAFDGAHSTIADAPAVVLIDLSAEYICNYFTNWGHTSVV